MTHAGLPDGARARLEQAAGRSLALVEVAPDTDYYAAKNAGFVATRAEVVVFADSDCWPDAGWLEALLRPFEADEAVEGVAGRTSYRDDLFGAAATAIDFMYFPSPLGEGCTRNFYANNVAFRRAVFGKSGYAPDTDGGGFYRGSCQVLGLALQARGVKLVFAEDAHTVHRLPDSARDLLRLRLLRGADAMELAPHLGRAYLPPAAQGLANLGLPSAAGVLAARWVCSLAALRRQRMPAARGVGWVAGAMLVTAIHAADGAGAVLRALGRGGASARPRDTVLSYHRDVDGLAAAG